MPAVAYPCAVLNPVKILAELIKFGLWYCQIVTNYSFQKQYFNDWRLMPDTMKIRIVFWDAMNFKKTLIKDFIRIIYLTAIFLAPIHVYAFGIDFGVDINIGDSGAKSATTSKTSPVKHNGPPDHAPAHGYRAKHKYEYYPDSQVYFESSRGLYFYLSGSSWKMSASLPLDLKVKLGNQVTIEMDSDKPYTKYDEHKAKYPPRQMKKASHKNKSAKNNSNKNKNHK